METILERFVKIPAAALSDELRGQHTLDPAIHCLTPGHGIAGPAYTVLAEAGSIISVHKALMEAPKGSVIVVGGETSRILHGALFGKLMGIQSQINGVAGVVIDGAVRDIGDLREMGFPVFARTVTPRVGTNKTIGQTQVPTPCGGVVVYPGDWIRGDDDGVMVVPAADLEETIRRGEARLVMEEERERKLHSGVTIAEMTGLKEVIQNEAK